MGGAVIARDTTLLPLSLVLKEMNIPTAVYEGSPAEPVSGSSLLAALRRRGGGYPELAGAATINEEYPSLAVSDEAKR